MEEEYQQCQQCNSNEKKRTTLKYYNIIISLFIGFSYNVISKEFKKNKCQIFKFVSKIHDHSDINIDLSNYHRQAVLDVEDLDFTRQLIQSTSDRIDINLNGIKEELQTVDFIKIQFIKYL
ncbi:transmembrane protein, putative (macronuclear) [Tetrahymena thermophila SB210]|uniref:Transmembrane protein, putative n=1 Tax=Tetrahymena thermophila (strain SB210) TaxID=312017 RepID=W7X1S6_TETTS|nr:transmembrane protein, putative [Tetrahymena thermophila SB210]EWS71577.1 transmembrane protein, putative [Tetrahymena thermophila SB210]|eukprot:XP_012655890.1 transmembrane protein, putative [Tetrahymena thermophila SB210]